MGTSSRVARGIPRLSACCWVATEVGTHTMSVRVPLDRSSPTLATAKAAVDPVPRPTLIPLFTYSTAFHAACFLSSS